MAKRQASAPQTNISELAEVYSPPEQFFVADMVAPRIPVDSSRFAYLSFNTHRQQLLQNNVRAPMGQVESVDWDASENTGMTVEKALQSRIDRKTVVDFGRAVAEGRAMRAVKDNLLIQKEERVRSLIQTTSNYASSSYYTDLSTATDKWNDFENSDPEDDVRVGIKQIMQEAHIMPNTLMVPYEVAEKLVQHPSVRDVLVRDGRGSSSEAFGNDIERLGLPSSLWGLNVMVPKVTYVSANPGQTESSTFLWAKDVWIGHVANSVATDMPSFAYQFTSVNLNFSLGDDGRAGGGEYVEGYEDDLEKVVGTRMGYLIQNAVS